jgi:hypothetical protein
VRKHRPGHQVQGADRGLGQAADRLPRGDVAAPDRGADLARLDRAEVRGEQVVGDQHVVDAGQSSGRNVQPPGPVQQRGLQAGQHLDPRHGPDRVHGQREPHHPLGVGVHVVDQADPAQPAPPGYPDVLRHRAGPVGEQRVHVEVLGQRAGGPGPLPFARGRVPAAAACLDRHQIAGRAT